MVLDLLLQKGGKLAVKKKNTLCAIALSASLSLSGVGLSGCAPKPIGIEPPQSASTYAVVARAKRTNLYNTKQISALDQRLHRMYSNESFGRIIRNRTFGFISDFADMGLYRREKNTKNKTYTLVCRSYSKTFKQIGINIAMNHYNKMRYQYRPNRTESTLLEKKIRRLVKPVDHFRIDMRYKTGEKKGIVYVYEYKQTRKDRLLGKVLISRKIALSFIHYSDINFFGKQYDNTIMKKSYKIIYGGKDGVKFVRK